ncbi:hypothetical protein GIJ74_10880 [Glaesserella parasuis]|uniref:hypothetical protein n=1 Tax=Glaesserella parasuis TaxID=738 RepID=UPI001365F4B1|nr:hypothetical protein [Glaesserella parasuis]MDO9811954.1 hypothetical protein [Glaesserella parasuis]MDO9846518.1 hypothetical protein [Glaesserella parasuis]MDO9965853.1 hypothetical protein [Glaesserella parasuis]MDP0042951.1 hypothetical protein [Glaesserella parasuis]MDP0076375.1 hypothetical protein [Glaesserella parasuis]
MNRGITFTPPQNDHINMQKTAIQHQIEMLLEPFDAIERMQINAEKHFELKKWLTQAFQNELDVAQQDRSPT